METINGEWYMKGCAPEDPGRLCRVEDAATLIEHMGFLPLFANEVPGFSLEEHSLAADWWSGDPTRDPWEWRQILCRMPGIVYGKFFEKKAGFISARWFPVFANHRRDGYDFDTRIDEGLASHRAVKLMAPFLTEGGPNDTALLSAVLKAQAGFGKGGEKNFEGILTELQMQSYLILGDFRQRLNRRGEPYGWHLALVQTPEAKLGCEAVRSAYSEDPAHALERMTKQLLLHFPAETAPQLRRLLSR